jgi:hypothetical protein
MRMPAVEALFPVPWTAAARRMLPSPSPQFTATAMWGPILGWGALELLAESIDAENPERTALDLFDRLRLREPFAQVFSALGFEGEEGWRVAARIKVVLLTVAGVGKQEDASVEAEGAKDQETAPAEAGVAPLPSKPEGENSSSELGAREGAKVALSPALWRDPDVRWLCGVHEAEGHAYVIREQYEELLWWLLMPSLLRLAGEPTPNRATVEELSRTVAEALATAEAAGYRIDKVLGEAVPADEPEAPEAEEGKELIEQIASPAEETRPPELVTPEPQAIAPQDAEK